MLVVRLLDLIIHYFLLIVRVDIGEGRLLAEVRVNF